MSQVTGAQVQQGMSVLTSMLQAISNVFSTAKANGTTVDKPTLVGTLLEVAGVGAASMLTGGAATTATWAVPVGESFISEAVNFFEQLHSTPTAAPAPNPTPVSTGTVVPPA